MKTASLAGDSLFRVRVERTPAVLVRPPEFILVASMARSSRNWDLHPDGKRFVATVPDVAAGRDTSPSRYLIALNWFTELKTRMALR